MHSLAPRLERALPGIWILILLMPTIVWVFAETKVWTWDPAYYGYWTLRLAAIPSESGFPAWVEASRTVLGMMPPLLVWLGQFFVPLRHVTGDVETAIMLVNLLAAGGTLFLIYRLTRDLGASLLAGLAAATVCGGANLFIGLSRHYLTEPLQGFTAALSMTVALHAEQRSYVRNAALVLILLSLSFLAKATSFIFVLPALTYIAVALIVTSGSSRPKPRRWDYVLLAVGAVMGAAAVAWYARNWAVMATHFVQASVGEEVQMYRTATPYIEELRFWVEAMAYALSLSPLIPLGLAAIAVVALAVTATRLPRNGTFLRQAVANHTLFGFYVAGMVTLGLISYGFQINHDPRFLTPLIAPAAAMVGWTLCVFRQWFFAAAVLIASAGSAAAAHALTFGYNVGASAAWLWIVDRSYAEKTQLLPVIAATCRGDAEPSVIGVSISWTNSNTANFYGEKQRLETGTGCLYHSPPQDSLKTAMDWLILAKARYIVTVAPDQQDGPEFANPISKPMAEQLAADTRFVLSPASTARFKIYEPALRSAPPLPAPGNSP